MKTCRLIIEVVIPDDADPTSWVYNNVTTSEDGEEIYVLEEQDDPFEF